MLALVLLGVIVTEFDREDRLLRAEGGREEDRLSDTHTHQSENTSNLPYNIFKQPIL